jgi:hypothetical protein
MQSLGINLGNGAALEAGKYGALRPMAKAADDMTCVFRLQSKRSAVETQEIAGARQCHKMDAGHHARNDLISIIGKQAACDRQAGRGCAP